MTMEFTAGRGGGRLPGGPKPYFLSDGEGEKAIVIDSLFTVLLSADETDGPRQFWLRDGLLPARHRKPSAVIPRRPVTARSCR
jgi:hypothetical protein